MKDAFGLLVWTCEKRKFLVLNIVVDIILFSVCLLYTSDAADE